MNNLSARIRKLRKSPAGKEVRQRLAEFASFKGKSKEQWFSELCFCILTANSRAETALRIQRELGPKGFMELSGSELAKRIREKGHRFHNNKARFIVAAREHGNVKRIIQGLVVEGGEEVAREWLVKNVKGIGYKEASHFLRNVGYKDLAILDRHIISLMHEAGLIEERPKLIMRKNYLAIEERFRGLAKTVGLSPAELDLRMWCMKTGKVLK